MKLRGTYNGGVEYNSGDVVLFSDGFVYHLQNICPAGTEPVDTRYWGKVDPFIQEAVVLILDGIGLATDIAEAYTDQKTANISDEAILLKGTGDNEYLITVDDSGDTPELDVTLVTEEAEE